MTIYLVACGKEKANHSIQARHMYIGPYFKACLRYAESQPNDGIYILSAKYGLVELDQIIQPYDLIITDNDAIPVEVIKEQATGKGLLSKNIVMLGGKKYLNFAKKIWPDVACPLMGGLLKQISWLNEQTNITNAKKQMELWK